MKDFIAHLFAVFIHMGGLGLLLVSFVDSSFFFFVPLGHDLLIVALTARKPSHWPFYVVMATAGSVLGCLVTDVVARKGGEAGLERHVPKRRLEYVKRKVKQSAGYALAFAAVMPPPFPFTAFVVAAAALQYPRKRLLAVIAGTRFVRFTATCVLALIFGRHILAIARLPIVRWAIFALIVICVVGSVLSVYYWVKRSRGAAPRPSSETGEAGQPPAAPLPIRGEHGSRRRIS